MVIREHDNNNKMKYIETIVAHFLFYWFKIGLQWAK